jgi:hypothetical protein
MIIYYMGQLFLSKEISADETSDLPGIGFEYRQKKIKNDND